MGIFTLLFLSHLLKINQLQKIFLSQYMHLSTKIILLDNITQCESLLPIQILLNNVLFFKAKGFTHVELTKECDDEDFADGEFRLVFYKVKPNGLTDEMIQWFKFNVYSDSDDYKLRFFETFEDGTMKHWNELKRFYK